jgi:hypothetical protein
LLEEPHAGGVRVAPFGLDAADLDHTGDRHSREKARIRRRRCFIHVLRVGSSQNGLDEACPAGALLLTQCRRGIDDRRSPRPNAGGEPAASRSGFEVVA